MRIARYSAGFGRVEDDHLIPMGSDISDFFSASDWEDGDPIDLSTVVLLPPLPPTSKLIGVGPNYLEHATEAGQVSPESADDMIVMAMFANSLVGHGATVHIPASTQKVDFEAELGVVIGRTARDVSVGDSLEYVAGYVCVNDLTDRHNQFRLGGLRGLILSKTVDEFLPVGPYLTTADEVGDPQELTITCSVNNEELQRASTRDMTFGVAEIIASLSKTITLLPGDMIATGSPPGIGWGRNPQRFLDAGDVVTVEIDKVGTLTNRLARRDSGTLR